jgi:hypothetical protein
MDVIAEPARLSRLDSDRFRMRIARAEDVTAARLPALLDFCRAESVAMLIARCSVDDAAAVKAMEQSGFLLMDTQVRYGRSLEDGPPLPAPDGFPLQELGAGEASAAADLAREAFRDYNGHYHNDPRLDPSLAAEAYASYAERCCNKEAADVVLGAYLDGRLAAFGAFTGGERSAVLVLGAVSARARGHRLYGRLTVAGMRWAQERRARRLEAATQVTNLAAQKSWIRAGMEPMGYQHTFHRWFE